MNTFNQLVTYLIPIRIDSPERLANLNTVIRFLVEQQDATIFILEADVKSQLNLDDKYKKNCTHWFVEDENPIYHRTRYLNQMSQRVQTPIIAIWDADIIVSPSQIEEAIEKIKNQDSALCIAHNGRVCYLSQPVSNQFKTDLNGDRFSGERLSPIYGWHTVGGAVFVDREKYLAAGGENETFYGWGVEDNERVMRMEILYGAISRTSQPAIHLYHPILENSQFASIETELQNRKEFLKICRMSKAELQRYISPLQPDVSPK